MINNFWNDLTSHGSFELLALLALAAVKATLLFGFAALLCLAFVAFQPRHAICSGLAYCAPRSAAFSFVYNNLEVPVLPCLYQV
jgi:hypothetical protein